jgi:hypothetical protein
MAIGIYSHPLSMTAQRYEEINKALEAAGAGAPEGRLYHVCFGSGDSLQIFDVFDSHESLNRFVESLTPILRKFGVDPGMPLIEPVHNIIVGS